VDDDTPTHGMRGLVANCVREAAKRGTNVVEAEHVLLALAADTASPTAALLADAGLRYDTIDSALRAERLQSLAAAGVTPVDASLPTAAPRTAKPAWGASVAAARAREHRGPPGERRRRSPEVGVLIGILRAEIGTVPRALSIAGIDRSALIVGLEQL
jgi:hypothetical protein